MNTNVEFGYPWFLLLLLIIPVFLFLRFKKRKKNHSISIPTLKALSSTSIFTTILYSLLYWARLIAIILLIVALARPRIVERAQILEHKKGIDIMLTVDISYSMLAKDLEPDRLTALKKVATKFIKERPVDRIGLVAYAGEALTLVPLTIDRNILEQQINNLDTEYFDGSTAIGGGLATAITHLKDRITKSKIIILITDGKNTNDSFVDPYLATEIAVKQNIKVYTIGIGKEGYTLFPATIDNSTGEIYFENRKVDIDEDLLKHIAKETGGEYFRAIDNESLQNIYNNINSLEKSNINDLKYYKYTEKYRYFLIPALLLLMLELLLRTTLFKRI